LKVFFFKGNNFKMWKKLPLNILKANDLSKYITSNIFNQSVNEPNFTTKVNSKVVTLINKSIHPSRFNEVKDLDSAFNIIQKTWNPLSRNGWIKGWKLLKQLNIGWKNY